jgi:hypothetical protein
MPIQVVESLRLYRQIADQLSALIASGEFAAGAARVNGGWPSPVPPADSLPVGAALAACGA